jgi:serine/threonine protein kinase
MHLTDPEDATTKVGYGAFGVVYKGVLLTFDENRFKDIALKTILGVHDNAGKEVLKSLLNEIKVLSFIGYHPNIVYFIGACTVNLKKGWTNN